MWPECYYVGSFKLTNRIKATAYVLEYTEVGIVVELWLPRLLARFIILYYKSADLVGNRIPEDNERRHVTA